MWLNHTRSIAIVLLIVAHAMRHVQVAKPEAATPAVQAAPTSQFEISPELVQMLRSLIAEVTVTEEQDAPLQLAETTSVTAPEEAQAEDLPLVALANVLPDVTQEDITAVLTAFPSGVQRRNICGHLHWGTSKYSTIVKPVLDAYAHLQQRASHQETG